MGCQRGFMEEVSEGGVRGGVRNDVFREGAREWGVRGEMAREKYCSD